MFILRTKTKVKIYKVKKKKQKCNPVKGKTPKKKVKLKGRDKVLQARYNKLKSEGKLPR